MNYVELYFGIFDFEENNHDKITQILDISPTKLHYKGKIIHPKYSIEAKTNAWILENNFSLKTDSFEEKLNALLEILEPKIDILSNLSKMYYCEFSCAIFIENKEESNPWIHLGERYNEFAGKVNVEFDFDIYN